MHRASGSAPGSAPAASPRRTSGSRLFATLSRLSSPQAVERPSPIQVPSTTPVADDAGASHIPATAAPVVEQAAAPSAPVIDRRLAVEEWLAQWEERSEQIAYRLSLIDGQFEALIRNRELEAASSNTPPPVRQTVETLAHLFPEV